MAKKKPVKDFAKQKHRVGKLKPGAANATDTTVRSKSLNVREQHLSQAGLAASAGGDALRTKVSLLVTKSRHYSPSMRKEAYMSLSRTFKDLETEEMHRLLSLISESIGKAFIDEDEGVRGVALGLLHLILKRADIGALSAFFPGWIQFCLFALTHIEPAIKRDGLAFIAAAVEHKAALTLPSLIQILRQAVPALITKSAKPAKKGMKSDLEVVLLLIKLYADTASAKSDSRVYPDYTWTPVQTVSLRVVRPAPKSTGLEPIDHALLTMIIEKMLGAMSDAWLDLADQMGSEELSAQGKATCESIRVLRRLSRVVSGPEADDEVFWRAAPRSMLNVLGRDGRARLESFLGVE